MELCGPGSKFYEGESSEPGENGRASWRRRCGHELDLKDQGLERKMAIQVGKGQCTWDFGGSENPARVEESIVETEEI